MAFLLGPNVHVFSLLFCLRTGPKCATELYFNLYFSHGIKSKSKEWMKQNVFHHRQNPAEL